MTGIVVRNGEPDDVDAAVSIYLAADTARRNGRPTPPAHIDRARASVLTPGASFLIAEEDGVRTGMALAMQSHADDGLGPPIPGLCYVAMIFVDPISWGRGTGRMLVEAVLVAARFRGYERAELWTHADNLRAQCLYRGSGFSPTGREKFDDLGDRILLYQRDLHD